MQISERALIRFQNERFSGRSTNSRRSPADHQLDVRIDRWFRWADWKLSAYLDVQNVYVNPPVINYQYNYDYSERTEITGIPILPSFGLRGEL